MIFALPLLLFGGLSARLNGLPRCLLPSSGDAFLCLGKEMTADWTDRVYYGGDLPREAEKALHMAGAHWHEPDIAEHWLAQAMTLAPAHRAVQLGHYKYYFYRNQLVQATPYALACIRDAARLLNVSSDWRQVRAKDAAFSAPLDDIEAEPRFFLYALKAYGYILVRQGRPEEGIEALRKVVELDPLDRTATAGLLAVIERGPPSEDDD